MTRSTRCLSNACPHTFYIIFWIYFYLLVVVIIFQHSTYVRFRARNWPFLRQFVTDCLVKNKMRKKDRIYTYKLWNLKSSLVKIKQKAFGDRQRPQACTHDCKENRKYLIIIHRSQITMFCMGLSYYWHLLLSASSKGKKNVE